MLNDDQKKLRRTGLGGSDIATLLGINPYSNELQLYLEKVEGFESPDISEKESVIWGNLLEDIISQRYSSLTGKQVIEIPTVRHAVYPYFLANPDRIIEGEKRGLEIKNVGARMAHLWGESGSKIIPEYYYPQIMHYLFVLDYDFWDVAVLIGGQELRIYEFERDKEFDEIIIRAGSKFWLEHVETKNPPPADWNGPNAKAIVQKLYSAINKDVVDLDDKCERWRDVWLEAKEIIKKYQGIVDGAQSHILGNMKEAGKGIFRDGSGFIRKLIKTKGYTVEPSEYVSFSFKKGIENE